MTILAPRPQGAGRFLEVIMTPTQRNILNRIERTVTMYASPADLTMAEHLCCELLRQATSPGDLSHNQRCKLVTIRSFVGRAVNGDRKNLDQAVGWIASIKSGDSEDCQDADQLSGACCLRNHEGKP